MDVTIDSFSIIGVSFGIRVRRFIRADNTDPKPVQPRLPESVTDIRRCYLILLLFNYLFNNSFRLKNDFDWDSRLFHNLSDWGNSFNWSDMLFDNFRL